MTERGVSASQEMRAIRRGRAEAAVEAAATDTEAAAARARLRDLDAAESDRQVWELLLALQPYTISNHRWPSRKPAIPQQRSEDAYDRHVRSAFRSSPPDSRHRTKALAQPRAGGWFVRPKDRE